MMSPLFLLVIMLPFIVVILFIGLLCVVIWKKGEFSAGIAYRKLNLFIRAQERARDLPAPKG
jgi:hypothetical protein